jgi:uncharacterized membrane protein
VVISLIGFLDASFLTAEHYLKGIVPCSLGSCETVLTSSYATLFSLPLALFGVLFYASIFFAALRVWEKGTSKLFNFILVVTGFGFAVSLFLVYLQFFVLHAICLYCFGSALSTTLLFGASLFIFIRNRGKV